MKATKATVKKVITSLGMNIDEFKIHSARGIVEVETALEDKEKGNKKVSKLVKTMIMSGITFYGFKTGYGAWIYRLNDSDNWSRKLARMNID